MGLGETIVDHIDVLSRVTEESAHLLGADSLLEGLGSLRFLCLVGREHIFGPVDILAEVEVVYLFGVAAVTVTAGDKVKHSITGRHNVQVLHHTEELLSSDVLGLGAIKVLESWLQKDSIGEDMLVQVCHHLDHLLLLLISEHLF